MVSGSLAWSAGSLTEEEAGVWSTGFSRKVGAGAWTLRPPGAPYGMEPAWPSDVLDAGLSWANTKLALP
jgi:hypothetical protein